MWPEIWGVALIVLAPVAFLAARIHKRRRGGQGFPMMQQLKHSVLAGTILILLLLIAAIARGDTPQRFTPLASATRSGKWTLSGKEIALPKGHLCQTHARILGRHVTLKVAGAQMFEATVAIVRPQHKRGNVLSVYVDNEEVESVQLQYGQEVHLLRIPLPSGAQTLTLTESKPFPKVILCNPALS